MPALHDQIAAYLRQHLPGAEIKSVYAKSFGLLPAFISAATDNGTYTINVSAGPDGKPTFLVTDSDGDPIKNLFPTWQDAADAVVAALMPAPVS